MQMLKLNITCVLAITINFILKCKKHVMVKSLFIAIRIAKIAHDERNRLFNWKRKMRKNMYKCVQSILLRFGSWWGYWRRCCDAAVCHRLINLVSEAIYFRIAYWYQDEFIFVLLFSLQSFWCIYIHIFCCIFFYLIFGFFLVEHWETTSEKIDRHWELKLFRLARLSPAFGTVIDQKRRQIAMSKWTKEKVFKTEKFNWIEVATVTFDLKMFCQDPLHFLTILICHQRNRKTIGQFDCCFLFFFSLLMRNFYISRGR